MPGSLRSILIKGRRRFNFYSETSFGKFQMFVFIKEGNKTSPRDSCLKVKLTTCARHLVFVTQQVGYIIVYETEVRELRSFLRCYGVRVSRGKMYPFSFSPLFLNE